jgi:hypothetical protein
MPPRWRVQGKWGNVNLKLIFGNCKNDCTHICEIVLRPTRRAIIWWFRHQNLWQWNRRPTCEGGNSKPPHHIQQNTEKCYKKDIQKESIREWQSYWEETIKGAINKEFFPSVESRLAVNLKLSPNLTTVMTGHGNIRSCLHRLKIIGSPECLCKHGIQMADHLIFQCKRLRN